MRNSYKGPERRKFVRLTYAIPIAYKVCKKETISKLLQGYTSNISQAGLFCNINEKVKKDDILWLSFDRDTLTICEELEKLSFIYQSGVIGKVLRIEQKSNGTYDVGIQFITREEKNLTYIYPKIYFTKEAEQEESDAELMEEEEQGEKEQNGQEQGQGQEEAAEGQDV